MRPTRYRWSQGRAGELVAMLRMLAGYWLTIFPAVRREMERWRQRAQEIPNLAFRDIADATLVHEGLNAEGAALFAMLAPRRRRQATVLLLVRFQILYDYLDALTERRVPEPARTSLQLHRSLIAALGGGAPSEGYFVHHPHGDDGGYLAELVTACRTIFCALPSAALAAPLAIRAARRSAEGQSRSHASVDTLVVWAEETTPAGSDLRWWETAAAAESSLLIHALLASAADARLSARDVARIAAAYWPWITGLNALLDDLIDTAEDAAAGTHSYIKQYANPEDAACRLGAIAASARRAIDQLPLRRQHATIVAAMASFYLAAPAAGAPDISPVARSIRQEIGSDLRPLLVMVRVRRAFAALARS
jgi:tetraprenyl-beta-curcumene synthase